jgi:hypothetical protein
VRVEIHGWTPSEGEVRVNGSAVQVRIERADSSSVFTIANDGKLAKIEVQ